MPEPDSILFYIGLCVCVWPSYGPPSSRVHCCSTRPPEQGKMPIFGGFARRPNVNGLYPWVASTEVYVKWAKTTARYPQRSTIQVAHQRKPLLPPTVSGRASVHAVAGCVAILAAKADQSVK